MSDYEALKAYGHSPAKAAEIVLDAKRGDFFSRGWIKVVRQHLFGPEQTDCGVIHVLGDEM